MKTQLEALVLEMHRRGILYSEAVHEFKKAYITAVLRENKGNRVKSARALRMHRNTLYRMIWDLKVDVKPIPEQRRPPEAARPFAPGKKKRLL